MSNGARIKQENEWHDVRQNVDDSMQWLMLIFLRSTMVKLAFIHFNMDFMIGPYNYTITKTYTQFLSLTLTKSDNWYHRIRVLAKFGVAQKWSHRSKDVNDE